MAIFLKDGLSLDGDVMQALESETLSAGVAMDQVYATLLAIFILMERFADREDEWTLLARKAKTFLRDSGVAKPDKILRLFSNIEVILA